MRIDLNAIDEHKLMFKGKARQAALTFPANNNVAAALALADIGPEDTRVEVWADPALTRNVHHLSLRADSANIDAEIEIVQKSRRSTECKTYSAP